MKTCKKIWILAVATLGTVNALAQDDVRASSSNYLPAYAKTDVNMSFTFASEGKRFTPTWGLDLAWYESGGEQNIMKGINHMGKENIGIGRTAYRFTKALTNDSILDAADVNYMRNRATLFNKISATLPLTFTADQEAGADTYFVKNKSADVDHWAAMINSHVHWMQANTKHPIAGVSPFNEPDYWTVEEGATVQKQWQVAKILKEKYPRMADIPIVGGNTLNNDKALEWYTSGKAYYDWGNTHQLAGSFDNFANFFQQLQKDGKVGYADEMHNVGEAMIGLEYGMTVGIWWGFDSRARGEFCDISRHGERLAYAEHRNNWTAGSVYRHDDGRVKAFFGSSERQALTTSYQVVSVDRDVYFDGHGPLREYSLTLKGGTGYQNGQTNVERVVDVTWGEDVQPAVIDGVYQVVNVSGGVLTYTASGNNILIRPYTADAKQKWEIHPATQRTGGDISFYDFEASDNRKIRPNVRDYSTSTNASIIAWTQDAPSSNEQWYLEYAGNGYYYIRNRESALYLTASNPSSNADARQSSLSTNNEIRKRQMWRLLPVDVTFDTTAPAVPQGLTATAEAASVRLEWNANTEADLDGYMVVRAEQGTDLWNTIARKVKVNHFVDNNCTQGHTYIYKVKAIDKSENQSECTETVQATPTGHRALVAQWLMDGNLNDETANMMDAVCSSTANYTDGHDSQGKAITITNRYVQLPYEVANSEALTVAMWVKSTSVAAWQRLFDFGHDTEHYMFLTPNNSYTSVMRFAIKNGGSEQTVDCKAKLPTSQWKHVAVTIGDGSVCIYQDGELVGSSTGITIKPCDIHPVLNYLGRSMFASDPYFAGQLDDVRIYNFALTADEVKGVMSNTFSGIQSTQAETQKASTIYGMDGKRLDAPQAGVNIIDGKKVLLKP